MDWLGGAVSTAVLFISAVVGVAPAPPPPKQAPVPDPIQKQIVQTIDKLQQNATSKQVPVKVKLQYNYPSNKASTKVSPSKPSAPLQRGRTSPQNVRSAGDTQPAFNTYRGPSYDTNTYDSYSPGPEDYLPSTFPTTIITNTAPTPSVFPTPFIPSTAPTPSVAPIPVNNAWNNFTNIPDNSSTYFDFSDDVCPLGTMGIYPNCEEIAVPLIDSLDSNLPIPTNFVVSCSADGRTGTFSWSAPAGYNTFYTRAGFGTNSFSAPARDDNFVGTSKTFATVPGNTYWARVHTKDTRNGNWSNSVEGMVTCPVAVVVTPTPTSTVATTTTPTPVANKLPAGQFDVADCTRLAGWAFDPNASSTSIGIVIKEGSEVRQTATANILRNGVNTVKGITGNHGFDVPTPASLKDGLSHALKAYGVDMETAVETALGPQAPRTFTCSTATTTAPAPTTSTSTPAVAPVPTGTLSLTSCTIGSGSILKPTRADVCDSKISWTTTNATSAYIVITGSSPYLRNIYPNGYTTPGGTGLTKTDVPFWTPAGTYTVGLYANGTYPQGTTAGTGIKLTEQTITVAPAVSTSTATTTTMYIQKLVQLASASIALNYPLVLGWIGSEVAAVQKILTSLGLLQSEVIE